MLGIKGISSRNRKKRTLSFNLPHD